MTDFIIVGILLIIVGTAIVYIMKAKKGGTKCIGCPAGGSCSCRQESQPEGSGRCHSCIGK